jgi:hypothetical protein
MVALLPCWPVPKSSSEPREPYSYAVVRYLPCHAQSQTRRGCGHRCPTPRPQRRGAWRPCPPPGGSLHTGLRPHCASVATKAGLYMELAIRRRSSSGSSARFSSAGVIGVSPRTSPSSASRFSFTVAFPPKKYFTRRVSYARGLHSSGRARRYPQLASNASVTCCSLITADCKAGCQRSARSWCCYSSSRAWQ